MYKIKKNPKLIGINFSDSIMTCSYIEECNKHIYSLKTLKYYELNHQECYGLINLKYISNYLEDFLYSLSASYAYASVSIEAPNLYEDIQCKPPAWHNQNSYQLSDDPFRLYECFIKQELIFQHQLLSLKTNVRYISLVPKTVAQIKAIQYFKKQNLVCETIIHMHKLIDEDIESLKLNPTFEIMHQTKKECINALGLFLIGKEYYEFNKLY